MMLRLLILSLIATPTAARAQATAASTSAQAQPVTAFDDSAPPLPHVLVYKPATCGCCRKWVAHLEAAGFSVEARDVADIAKVKREAGVPDAVESCHTALVGGYFVEGHIPADQLKRLLVEKPEISGIAVPGMPIGSPGMEGPGAEPYEVVSVEEGGQTSVFAEVDPR